MRLRDAVQEVELFFARPKGSMGMCREEAIKVILRAALRLYLLESPNAKSTV